MGDGDKTPTIEEAVVAEIRTLLEVTGRRRDAVGEGDRLEELGLTSLDLADLVAALNVKLAVNPFRHFVAFTDVRTVADLFGAYLSAAKGDASPTPLGSLEETRQRALARRAASQG
jgi:acyl carrier protein